MSSADAKTLGVIGAGNMAAAILRGVVDSRIVPAPAITAFDPAEERRDFVRGELGISCANDNREAARCPRVLLSVKPHVLDVILPEIEPVISDDTILVSIAAGVTSGRIDKLLKGKGRIVRAMPNTPMLVGEGMSAVAQGPRATEEDLDWVRQLLGASGQVVLVEEPLLDAVTAVSGSGPAYFFYLVEAMTAAGVEEGLSRETAAQLAAQTCLGAGRLLVETGTSAEELRRMVTTPGGTTEAAIKHLDQNAVHDILVGAIDSATRRSRELRS